MVMDETTGMTGSAGNIRTGKKIKTPLPGVLIICIKAVKC